MCNETISETPRFRFPAEWEPHRATWLSYPHNPETWPGQLDKIFAPYNEFVRIVSTAEKVHINVCNAQAMDRVQSALTRAGVLMENVVLHEVPTDDAWCRDHGPCFAFACGTGRKVIVHWRFNSWGGKYPYALDDQVPSKVAAILGLPLIPTDIVMEGGSIDVNGAGCLLTTMSCLLNPNRNPQLSRDEIEAVLSRYYGATQVVWLGEGIVGDDTDGHVDDMTRFIGENRVVTVVERNSRDENYGPLRHNRELLGGVRLRDGRRLEVVELPMPEPIFHDGQRLPASYANFYICNAAVVVPTFRCRRDAEALAILGDYFDRPVIGVDAREIIQGLGSFHCLSQQEPAAPGEKEKTE